jgi:hypothetical protein
MAVIRQRKYGEGSVTLSTRISPKLKQDIGEYAYQLKVTEALLIANLLEKAIASEFFGIPYTPGLEEMDNAQEQEQEQE